MTARAMTQRAMAQAATAGLEVYVVGGAVRDALLGLPAGDRDWVVVGATPEDMLRRGFTPVGGDFPVFLHPLSKEEYALARTERKSGRGYRGFTFYTGPEVTLVDDLRRRDLRINAMAQAADGTLIDPCGGVADVQARVLQHIGPAFAEDPVRILRLARFAARFADFSIAPETVQLCRAMVAAGEADALVPERIWREVSRGLMSAQPARLLTVLAEVDALPRVLPGLVVNDAVCARLARAAQAGLPLAARYALMCSATPEPQALSAALRAPRDCAEYARLLVGLLVGLSPGLLPRLSLDGQETESEAVLALIEQADGLRKPERFLALLDCAALCGEAGQAISGGKRLPWSAWLVAVRAVDAGAIAKAVSPAVIKTSVRAARLAALGQAMA